MVPEKVPALTVDPTGMPTVMPGVKEMKLPLVPKAAVAVAVRLPPREVGPMVSGVPSAGTGVPLGADR